MSYRNGLKLEPLVWHMVKAIRLQSSNSLHIKCLRIVKLTVNFTMTLGKLIENDEAIETKGDYRLARGCDGLRSPAIKTHLLFKKIYFIFIFPPFYQEYRKEVISFEKMINETRAR